MTAGTSDDFVVSVGRTTRPDGDRAPGELPGSERPEVAAVEACREVCKKEVFSVSENPAAVPDRHRPFSRVAETSERSESMPDKDMSAETTDTVTRNRGDGLQQIRGTLEIGPALHQGGNWTGETDECKVADSRARLFDPIDSDRNAQRCVPDEERRLAAYRWGDEKRKRD